MQNVLQEAPSWWWNYDMNATQANAVDGKSMTCIQVSNSSSVAAAAARVWDKAQTKIFTEVENFKRNLLGEEQENNTLLSLQLILVQIIPYPIGHL